MNEYSLELYRIVKSGLANAHHVRLRNLKTQKVLVIEESSVSGLIEEILYQIKENNK